MNPISLIALAFAMSTDAFATAITKGASLSRPPIIQVIKIGCIFGAIEAIMPLLGWTMGIFAAKYVTAWDHWIAFVLLVGLGLHMIWAGLKPDDSSDSEPDKLSTGWKALGVIVLTAVATSIDALALGVTLAFAEVNIIVAAIMIGFATTLMVSLGLVLGGVVGAVIGKRSELIGGGVLILIGTYLLYEGLIAG